MKYHLDSIKTEWVDCKCKSMEIRLKGENIKKDDGSKHRREIEFIMGDRNGYLLFNINVLLIKNGLVEEVLDIINFIISNKHFNRTYFVDSVLDIMDSFECDHPNGFYGLSACESIIREFEREGN